MAGYRIEGRRARYVSLEGEGSENDRVLFTVQEAAQRLEVSVATIRAWVKKGRLESFRIEGERRIYVVLDLKGRAAFWKLESGGFSGA